MPQRCKAQTAVHSSSLFPWILTDGLVRLIAVLLEAPANQCLTVACIRGHHSSGVPAPAPSEELDIQATLAAVDLLELN